MKKQQYQLEFVFRDSSFSALWDMISTPQGLEKWFADRADYIDDKTIGFEWNKQRQIANIKNIKANEYVRFHWEDMSEKHYFEFRVGKSELTGTLAMTITDFALPQDIEDESQLWESSVSALRRALGIPE